MVTFSAGKFDKLNLKLDCLAEKVRKFHQEQLQMNILKCGMQVLHRLYSLIQTQQVFNITYNIFQSNCTLFQSSESAKHIIKV